MMKRIRLSFCAVTLLSVVGCHEPSSASEAAQSTASAPTSASVVHHHHHHHAVEHHAAGDEHPASIEAAETPLSGGSIYNTASQFEDQHGKPLEVASLRHSTVLATMFYASCTSVCPMLISRLASIDRALSPAVRAQTRVLAITLDPERDTPAVLQELARRHGVEDPRWHFVRTSKADVRELAALLGIRYSLLANGEITHAPLIALLDHGGSVVSRSDSGGADPAALVSAIDRMTRATAQ